MSHTDPRADARHSGYHATAHAAAGHLTHAPHGADSPRNYRSAATRGEQQRLRALVHEGLEELKARDVREIDVRGKSDITDWLVVASGTSSRHVRAIAEEVVRRAKEANLPPIGVEGERDGEWALVDLGDVVVHVMQPRIREFYGLERLWTVGDQPPEITAAATG